MVRLTIAEIMVIGEWLDDNIRSITDRHVVIHNDYITVIMDNEEQIHRIDDIMAEY